MISIFIGLKQILRTESLRELSFINIFQFFLLLHLLKKYKHPLVNTGNFVQNLPHTGSLNFFGFIGKNKVYFYFLFKIMYRDNKLMTFNVILKFFRKMVKLLQSLFENNKKL